MSDMTAYELLVANVIATIEKHGYPDRRVALPLEKMYEVAHAKGLNFNKALALLEERGYAHEKTTEKVIFYRQPPVQAPNPFAGLDPEALKSASPAEMMARVGEMLKGLDPDQLAQLRSMVENMSEDERASLLQKAREMGFGP